MFCLKPLATVLIVKAAVIKIYIERKLEKPVSDSKMLFISLVLRLSRDIARAPGATFPQVFLLRL